MWVFRKVRLNIIALPEICGIHEGTIIECGSILIQELRGHSSALFFLLILIAAMMILRFGWSLAQIIGDLWRGKVISVEGPVARETRWSRYSRSYYYVAGSHKFQVSEVAYNALFEGRSYRLYYMPRSHRLVSIEPL